jgi:hypothetical protein
MMTLGQRFPNCGARPQGALLVLWGRELFYERHIYFERNTGAR